MGEGDAPPVLLLSGAPGSGKTSVARLLAGRSARGVHLESDLFFGFIEGGYIEPWKPESHEQNATVMRIVAAAAAGYAEAGYFTIVEGIIIPGWFYEPLRDSLHAAGHGVAFAVLRAPLSVCMSRPSGRLPDPEAAERLWRQFADLGALERHVIEVGEKTAEELASTISADLQADRLMA